MDAENFAEEILVGTTLCEPLARLCYFKERLSQACLAIHWLKFQTSVYLLNDLEVFNCINFKSFASNLNAVVM